MIAEERNFQTEFEDQFSRDSFLLRRGFMKKLIAGIVAGCAIAFGGHALAQETLTVWWVKGFYKSEDDALFAAIKKFEDKTKVKVELSQYPVQDMIPKTVSALNAGTGPMSHSPTSTTSR